MGERLLSVVSPIEGRECTWDRAPWWLPVVVSCGRPTEGPSVLCRDHRAELLTAHGVAAKEVAE